MKIKFGAIITDGCGSIGGHFISRNHYGRFQGTKVNPTNPQTVFQQARRAQLATLVSEWQAMSDAERDAWIDEAINYPNTDCTGSTYYPSGFNLFIGLNLNLWAVGQSTITAPALRNNPPSVGAFTVSSVVGSPEFEITWSAMPNNANTRILIYASPNTSPGNNSYWHRLRTIAAKSATGQASDDLSTEYLLVNPAVIAGSKILAQAVSVDINCGVMGVPFRASAIVS